MFSTLMNEHLHTKNAVFGGKPGENVEFKGAANAHRVCVRQSDTGLYQEWLVIRCWNGLIWIRRLRPLTWGTYVFFILLGCNCVLPDVALGPIGSSGFVSRPFLGFQPILTIALGW